MDTFHVLHKVLLSILSDSIINNKMPNKGVKSLKINPDTWKYLPILVNRRVLLFTRINGQITLLVIDSKGKNKKPINGV